MLKGFPDLPPVWALGLAALAWGLARTVPILPLPPGMGRLMIVAGLGLGLWAAWWFWRKRTTIEPHHAPGELIVEGPYRFSRNPIYLGMVAILTGVVVWLGALSAVAVPVAFAAILTRRFVEPEEAALRRAFGARAEAYLSATRRWL